MTRNEVDKLCVGDVVEINYSPHDKETWIVKKIVRGPDGIIDIVRAHVVNTHRTHTITITDLPEHWTLVERTIPDMHPLEQLRQKLMAIIEHINVLT